MAKIKITEIAARELAPFLSDNGYELYGIEFVKEGKAMVLRVYIDWGQEEANKYLGTDDCEKVSRFLSGRLDELDPIDGNYCLEVSSPGLDRALLKDRDYERYSGREVDISLYKAKDGKKSFSGELKGLVDDNVIIIDEKGNEMEFTKSQVAKTKLKIVF